MKAAALGFAFAVLAAAGFMRLRAPADPFLFGVQLAPLFAAIAQVESENGKTSDNVYQLSDAYIEDVNRIAVLTNKNVLFSRGMATDGAKSRQMMEIYLGYYGMRYEFLTGRFPTAEVLARIHNGGPDGWRKPSTLIFWKKVKAVMDAAKGAEQ